MRQFECECLETGATGTIEEWDGEAAAEKFVEELYSDGLLENVMWPVRVITRSVKYGKEEWEVDKYTETVETFAATEC